MATKYFNPYTDFGFKKLFGEEGSKDLLMDFLNQLLPDYHQIAELSFKNPEKIASTPKERKAIFDIYCQTKEGTRFIVEMQKAKVNFFKDRALFYSTFPIKEQAKKGEWNFELMPVYFIAILNFHYDEEEEKRKFRRDVCLKDQDGDIFYDKFHFKFLQMPLFKKLEDELETHFDKWVYFLKNLENFDHIPSILNEPIFQKGFEIAEISHLTPRQFDAYQKSLLEYSEVKNVSDTAFGDGEKIGIEKGKAEEKHAIAQGMLAEKLPLELIVKLTGLTFAEIERLTREGFDDE
ncbi:MAG: Rpn family recombination-promoting nuclease/putative transposase [Methylococcales bacterium]|nr:MAG: Rpn family recombination-promoting nuclease/putative transposase [Methylococcales bacterium]